MAWHVDLIQNRWSGGYQERVGRAYEVDGHLEVDADEHCRRIVLEVASGMEAERAQNRLLAERFHSDYFFVTPGHDDETCPFREGDRLPFNSRTGGALPGVSQRELAGPRRR